MQHRKPPRQLPRIGVGLKGRATWELVSRDGHVTARGEQPNLLLDQGLDLLFSYGYAGSVTTGYSNGAGIRQYLAVGTGSTEPDVLDAALDSELARTLGNGGVSDVITRTADGVYEFALTREFDFAEANGNLTEWGYSPTVSGNLAIRELFRDELGDPVTVTKTSDEKLRITHTLTVTLSPVTNEEHTIVMTGDWPDITGDHTLVGTSSGTGSDPRIDFRGVDQMLWGAAWPGSGNYNTGRLMVRTGYRPTGIVDYGLALSDATSLQASVGSTILMTKGSYVSGSLERSWSCFAGTTVANVEITGLALMYATTSSYIHGFWGMKWDVNRTKANTHQLSFTGFTVTAGRIGS